MNGSEISVRRSDHVLFQSKKDGSGFILNLETGRYFYTDRGGCLIWYMICEERSAQEIAERLSATYGSTDEYTRKIVSDHLQRLEKLGLIDGNWDERREIG